MDLRISDLKGPEAIRAILDRRPDTRVIALTVAPNDDDIDDAIQAEASGFLAKDTPIDAIAAAVPAAAGG